MKLHYTKKSLYRDDYRTTHLLSLEGAPTDIEKERRGRIR